MSQNTATIIAASLFAILGPIRVLLAEPYVEDLKPKLAPSDTRTCVFANYKQQFFYSAVENPSEMSSRNWVVEWSLIKDYRTINHGTVRMEDLANCSAPTYVLEVSTPPVRDGLVISAMLDMTWSNGNCEYRHRRPLHIFSPNPFAENLGLLEKANIYLFDPDGSTMSLLQKVGIPFRSVSSLATIEAVEDGVIIIAEGVSFTNQRLLFESLLHAASRGVSVLCLAPADGVLRLDALRNQEIIRPVHMAFQQSEVIRTYDKRFDELAIASQFKLASLRNEVVVEIVSSENDWSWLDIKFPASSPSRPSGHLMFCGLGIISHWESTPVPRYLFLHLLHDLHGHSRFIRDSPYDK